MLYKVVQGQCQFEDYVWHRFISPSQTNSGVVLIIYRYHFLSRIHNKHDKHSATTYGLNLRILMLREPELSVLDYWTCSQFDELQTECEKTARCNTNYLLVIFPASYNLWARPSTSSAMLFFTGSSSVCVSKKFSTRR